MLRYIIWAFIFYWLFRFIFNFLVPVFRATRQVKQQVRNFQDKAQGQGTFQGNGSQFSNTAKASNSPHEEKPRKGDYIDFEEIK